MAEGIPGEDPIAPKNFLNNRAEFAVITVFFIGLFLLAVGAGLYFFRNGKSSDDIQIISSESSQSGEIMVHIDGAVKAPGLYKLSASARVNDAVAAAGGLSAEANTAKLNLAAKVTDGQKVHIASVGEAAVISQGAGTIAGESTSTLIDINSASEAELDKLPGVGPVTAGKIIAARPYSSKEELVSKKAVSSSVFEKIKDLIIY